MRVAYLCTQFITDLLWKRHHLRYFDTAMAKLPAKKDQPGPGDDEFAGFLVNYLIDVKAADRLPQIKALFEADLVDPSIPGDYKEVAGEMQRGSRYTFDYKVYPSIFEHYDHIVQTWAGYKEDYRAILKNPPPVKTKDDIEITRPEYQPKVFFELQAVSY